MFQTTVKTMVPGAGIEPARLAAGDFESPASTNFTTRARESAAQNYGTVRGMIPQIRKPIMSSAGVPGCCKQRDTRET